MVLGSDEGQPQPPWPLANLLPFEDAGAPTLMVCTDPLRLMSDAW